MVRAGLGSAILPWLALADTRSDDRLRVHGCSRSPRARSFCTGPRVAPSRRSR